MLCTIICTKFVTILGLNQITNKLNQHPQKKRKFSFDYYQGYWILKRDSPLYLYVLAAECAPRCTQRCSKPAFKKPCMFFCQKCCSKCLCVPPGTFGNKEFCPCYNNWKTKRGGPKCP